MSLSISGIGAVQPIYAPSGHAVPYAQNPETTQSVKATTAGAESGIASVVYEPGASDEGQQLTYSNRDAASRAAVAKAASGTTPAPLGDSAVVAATGGSIPAPVALPETPHSAEVGAVVHTVSASVRPVMADPVAGTAAANAAPAEPDQDEASAQASYAAIADAMIAGAPLSDLEKFA